MATRKEYLDSIIEAAVRLKHFPDEVVFVDDLQRIDRELWFMHDNACDHVALGTKGRTERSAASGALGPCDDSP